MDIVKLSSVTLFFIILLADYSFCDSWSHFSTAPVANINAVAVEGNVIWCATDNGMMRVDVERNVVDKFHTYNGLAHDTVQRIIVDRESAVWCSYYEYNNDGRYRYKADHGVSRYDGKTWEYYNSEFPGDVVFFMFADSKKIGYDSYSGVSRWDGHTWTSYKPGTSGAFIPIVHEIVTDSSGALWFATPHGVSRNDNGEWTAFHTSNSELLTNEIASIAVGGGSDVWVLYNHRVLGGAARFDGEKWVNYTVEDGSFPEGVFSKMVIDGNGTPWVAGKDGLYRFDGAEWDIWNDSAVPETHHIFDVTVDARNHLWLMDSDYEYTGRQSVYRYDGDRWDSIDLRGMAGIDPGDEKIDLYSLACEGNEQVYFGTGDGIYTYDGDEWGLISKETWEASRLRAMWFLAVDGEGGVWYKNTGDIGYYIDGSFHWYSGKQASTHNTYFSVFDSVCDRNNNRYFCTSQGLRIINASFDVEDYWIFSRDVLVPDDVIKDGAVDDDGVFWYANYHDHDQLWKIEDGAASEVKEFPAYRVESLAVDKRGVLWIGTQGYGVYRYDGGEFTRFTTRDGLLDDTVNFIAVGPNNEKWFVSEIYGLTRYIDDLVVAVGDETAAAVPESFALASRPNPFNARTTISFTLTRTERVVLDVYRGRRSTGRAARGAVGRRRAVQRPLPLPARRGRRALGGGEDGTGEVKDSRRPVTPLKEIPCALSVSS